MKYSISRIRFSIVMLVVVLLAVSACGGAKDDRSSSKSRRTITVVAHDSFTISQPVLKGFSDRTGIDVKIATQGDAGAALNKAILTKNQPLGDVFFGVDNTLLTRALDSGIFDPYESPRLGEVAPEYLNDKSHRLTPVDHGEVCVDYDKPALLAKGIPVPATLDDLRKPAYKNLLVVENPATSSPGLAFLLATIASFGESGWQGYWKDLRANGVLVASGWEQAYNTSFSAGPGKGERPLVVSYASSPSADVAGSTGSPPADTRVGVVTSTCFRQTEFVGILKGTKQKAEAQQFVDFLLSREVQNDVPLQMYVYPVTRDATLPDTFTKYSVPVPNPIDMSSDRIGANRDRWVKEWSELPK